MTVAVEMSVVAAAAMEEEGAAGVVEEAVIAVEGELEANVFLKFLETSKIVFFFKNVVNMS